ncbi:hypothetical protein [Pseudodesulfovibrio sediminis]|uniref:hypothetical protein n=1 Tax=Pseudodesulfovibrio sediminis TaxID=2810563 RepID=UPI001E5C5E77|nr:hypothetical protein [Pseudodesulfovibrio sediminis]
MKKILTDFVKRHPVFFTSLFIWIFPWLFLFASLPGPVHYLFIPAYAFCLLLSLGFLIFGVLKPFIVFVWTGPVALLFIVASASVLGAIFPATDTYYIGIDVKTPTGLKSCTSMVQLNNTSFPPFTRQPKVKGEAIYCDLGDDKNLVALLSFYRDHYGLFTLRTLPWRAAGQPFDYSDRHKPFISGRYDLTRDLVPNLVTFLDTNDRNSMVRVYRGSMFLSHGEGFSIDRIWVEMTDDPYRSGGIKQHLPWIQDVFGGVEALEPFRAIELRDPRSPFVMNR